jgi:hypothetical protein
MKCKNYEMLKKGDYLSVGMLEGQYCFEILTGICDIPEYYPITKEEFDTFDEWKNNADKIAKDIQNRKIIHSGYTK